ncbi:MAG: HEAT repeat domain-containing protein [Leptospiraceae bacterium]|nr:HEAT repeat domain-containing protein [Leptospiraceae bacterium]
MKRTDDIEVMLKKLRSAYEQEYFDLCLQIAARGPDAVPALIQSLGRGPRRFRKAVELILCDIGPAAHPALLSLLQKWGRKRDLALHLLEHMEYRPGPELLTRLNQLMRSGSGTAALLLGRSGYSAVMGELCQVARQDEKMLPAAFVALARLQSRPALDYLFEMLRHDSKEVRFHAARALGMAGASAAPRLAHMISRDVPTEGRLEAILAVIFQADCEGMLPALEYRYHRESPFSLSPIRPAIEYVLRARRPAHLLLLEADDALHMARTYSRRQPDPSRSDREEKTKEDLQYELVDDPMEYDAISTLLDYYAYDNYTPSVIQQDNDMSFLYQELMDPEYAAARFPLAGADTVQDFLTKSKKPHRFRGDFSGRCPLSVHAGNRTMSFPDYDRLLSGYRKSRQRSYIIGSRVGISADRSEALVQLWFAGDRHPALFQALLEYGTERPRITDLYWFFFW